MKSRKCDLESENFNMKLATEGWPDFGSRPVDLQCLILLGHLHAGLGLFCLVAPRARGGLGALNLVLLQHDCRQSVHGEPEIVTRTQAAGPELERALHSDSC